MKMRKKVVAAVLILVMGATIVTGCGTKELPEVSVEDYIIAADAVSNVTFYAGYEELGADGFKVIYADAADGSYMQTIQPIANPEKLDWREVLINSGITNTEDFSMLLMSGAIDWKEISLGEVVFTYLDISAEGDDYAMGIATCQGADYGVMVYGNMLEAELLEKVTALYMDAEGFGITPGGNIPMLTFSDGGMGMQSYSVCYFETMEQMDAYLIAGKTGIRTEDILKSGETMTFAGFTMQVESYSVNGKGKLSFSGNAGGRGYAEGIVALPEEKGFLLIRFSERITEEKVTQLTSYLSKTEKYFKTEEQ